MRAFFTFVKPVFNNGRKKHFAKPFAKTCITIKAGFRIILQRQFLTPKRLYEP